LSEPAVPDPPKSPRKKNTYPEAFEQAWGLYPTDPNMSKAETFSAWKKLDEEDRQRLIQAIPGFRTYCRQNPDYRPIHMVRFIQKRRFDAYSEAVMSVDADWSKRLSAARTRKLWSSEEWGPMPGNPGCAVPHGMIEPGDGVGWTEWTRDTATTH